MDTSVATLLEIFNLNTRLFLNCLRDVGDATAQQRPGASSNNITFIALHVLDARCYLARILGVEYRMPYAEKFDSVSGIEDVEEYPPLEGIRESWRDVSDLLTDHLPALGETKLSENAPLEFPVEDRTLRGGIAFLLQHESSHIGQLGYLRKYLGLPAMTYTG